MKTSRVGFAAAAVIFVFLLSGCNSPSPTKDIRPSASASIAATATATPLPASGQPSPTPTPQVSASPTPAAAAPAATTLPGLTLLAVPTATAAPRDCTDIMRFITDVNVPDNTMFNPGESFTKTWRVYNSGTCTWDESYQLVFIRGDPLNGSMNNPIPKTAPGQTVDLSVSMTAPPRGGNHFSHWMLRNYAGHEFGAGTPPNIPLWVIINVNFYQAQINQTAYANPGQAENSNPPSASQEEDVPQPSESTDDTQNQPATDTEVTEGEAGTAETEGEEPDSSGGEARCNVKEDPAVLGQLLALVNQAREQNGLNSLEVSGALAAAARQHSLDMACSQNASHSGSDGSNWTDRVSAQGYTRPNAARENIYAGDPAFGATAQGVFNWWMGSKIHHDNILWPDVTEIGIGYAYFNGTGYYTLVVARP